jgi:hypothetical protein
MTSLVVLRWQQKGGSLIPALRSDSTKYEIKFGTDSSPKQIFWSVYVVVIPTHCLPGLSLSSYFGDAKIFLFW